MFQAAWPHKTSDIPGEPIPPPDEETQDDRHAGAVGNQSTSGLTSPVERRQKNDDRRQKVSQRHMGTAKKVQMATEQQQRDGNYGLESQKDRDHQEDQAVGGLIISK
jgi:hypothetical protein